MESDNFITQKPKNRFLKTIVDNYFYIDISVDALKETQEYALPFPRITFGYFFDSPFLVTNHDLKESKKAQMIISRISTQKITVIPLTNRIKIIGAHLKPYALSFFTKKKIHELPWLINTFDLFGETATIFQEKIEQCQNTSQMFDLVEDTFLNNLINKEFIIIKKATDCIEKNLGAIKLYDLSKKLNISERALREKFHKYVGCSPKEFIQLVKLKHVIKDMHFTNRSLTKITYNNNYFDQAHFINAFKKITGKSPNILRKEMINFRFLQF